MQKNHSIVLDIVQWFNFTTFDIVGDLAFGQSFDSLQDGALHPWVSFIFTHFKVACSMASTRFYPLISVLLMKCIPRSAMKVALEHFQLAIDRVNQRVNSESRREDFMTNVLKFNESEGKGINDNGGDTRNVSHPDRCRK